MPVLHGTNASIRRLNIYDCFSVAGALHDSGGHVRMFGNAHIGNRVLCNLQVPGQLAYDQAAVLNHWYARADLDVAPLTDQQRRSYSRFTCSTFVSLILGDTPQKRWTAPLSELLMEDPWEVLPNLADVAGLWDAPKESLEDQGRFLARFDARVAEGAPRLVVPVRQVIAVTVTAFQGQLHRLVQDLDGIQVMMWIHLEGMSIRDCG